tara:strand:+ start:1738 stop:3390 length:1653 start_codon:yes stop_codon:yes gene_type:complete
MLIKYDGKDVFEGQAEPLVSKTTSFINQGDNRVLIEESISLAGELTGCGMDELIAARNNAVEVFSTGFKNLEVTGIGVFTGVKVNAVNFDQSPYLASLPYTIDLTHYPSGGFKFGLGITDPVSAYTYTENTDQTVSVQHTVSVKGINTSTTIPGGNALDNAKTFVTSQLGEPPRPAMIDTWGTDFDTYLVDFNESVDKLNNTVSVDRSFESDPLDTQFGGNVILRYSSEHTQTEGEEITINYNGTIDGGRGTGATPALVAAHQLAKMKDVRIRYDRLKDGELGVSTFLNESVTEDTGICQLTFSFSHISGDNEPDGIVDDFTITVEENSDSSLFAVSINGNLSARGRGVGQTTFQLLSGRYDTINSHEDLCREVYDDFYVDDYGGCQDKPLNVNFNNIEIGKSVGYNEYDRTISYSASFNDRTKVDGYHTLDYTMNFTPSIWAVKSVASAYKDGWIVEDLDYRSRGIFSINCNARSTGVVDANEDKGALKDFAEEKFNKLIPQKLDEIVEANEYVLNNQEVSSSTFRASFYGEEAFTDQEDYTGILGFYL